MQLLTYGYTMVIFNLSFLRANLVIHCENWWNLAKQFARRNPPLHILSSSVQRTLMKALVLGGFAHMESDAKQQYWTEVSLNVGEKIRVSSLGTIKVWCFIILDLFV